MTHVAFVLLTTLLALPVAAAAQSTTKAPVDDPLLGTWYLNVAKSKFKPGPAPTSVVRIYEKHPYGIRATVKTKYADGRSTTVQSVYAYDQEEYPVTGSEDVDAIKVTRVNPYTHEATLSHAGHAIGSFRRVISEDGKQMTVTIDRRLPPSENVEVYDKEEP